MLADMLIKINAARLLLYQAAEKKDREGEATLEASIAKCYSTDIAMEVTTDAVQMQSKFLVATGLQKNIMLSAI